MKMGKKMNGEKYIIKVFSKVGSLYTKIFEGEFNSLEEVLENVFKEWKYADLVEIYYSNNSDNEERLLFVYTYS